jgi:hypothetical protein
MVEIREIRKILMISRTTTKMIILNPCEALRTEYTAYTLAWHRINSLKFSSMVFGISLGAPRGKDGSCDSPCIVQAWLALRAEWAALEPVLWHLLQSAVALHLPE